MMRIFISLAFLLFAYQVVCQSQAGVQTIAITTNALAQGSAAASGQQVAAQSTSVVSGNSAYASASAAASSGPQPSVAYVPVQAQYPSRAGYPFRSPYLFRSLETCHDIMDDECPEIDDFDKCAFCDLGNHKGYGVSYEIKTYKQGKNYYTVYELKKDCDGDVIYEGMHCPEELTCDDYLVCLKDCQDTQIITYTSGHKAYKVTQRCLSYCGVSQDIFDQCFH